MRIVVFFRKRRSGANSIEEIFNSLKPYLGANIEFIELPYSGAKPTSILKNICFARKHRGDVNHISGEVHYIALGLGRKTVLTIHDVHSIIKGNPIEKIIKKWLWFKFPILISNKISVVSQFTKNELIHDFPCSAHKINVIYNPITIHYFVCNSVERKPPYIRILHVGTKPNKNLEGVLRAIQGMEVKLTIIGVMTSAQTLLAESLHISYINLFNLPYEKVLELYHNTDIVTFPSFYEGFGMPIIEANFTNKPILVSDIDVLHEVAGDAAFFVNPYDIKEIRKGIIELLQNIPLRNNLIELGKQNIKRFQPQNIAQQYLNIYNSF